LRLKLIVNRLLIFRREVRLYEIVGPCLILIDLEPISCELLFAMFRYGKVGKV
jgi:hypothetical protein